MFRLLLVMLAVLSGVVWIEARWSDERRELVLRVRETREIVDLLRDGSRDLGRRLVGGAEERLAPVASPAKSASPGRGGTQRARSEHITPEEQARLDRLVLEKTREN